MDDLLDDLRARAGTLHRELRRGEESAAKRLTRLPELRRLSAEELASAVKRRHCLATVARELGFSGWQHLTSVLSGQESEDFGAVMYAPRCSAHFNIWSASYEEARAIRDEHGGYLLPYKNQFLIVDRHFLETLGLDPNDSAWSEMGRDWVRPASVEARARLCARLVRARLEQA